MAEAAKARELFLVRCEAMLAQGQAAALLDSLDPPSQAWPIRNSTRLFIAIEAARKLDQDDRADRLRETLITEAEQVNPPVTLISLAQRFEDKALYRDAEESYLYLKQKYPGQRAHVYDRLTHVYRALGDTKALQTLSNDMMLLDPENPIYRHNWAYLSFLRGEALTEVKSVLQSLVEAYHLAPSVCALALLAHENGDNATAQALIGPLAWEELSPLDQRIARLISPSLGMPKELRLTLLPEEERRFHAKLTYHQAASVVE